MKLSDVLGFAVFALIAVALLSNLQKVKTGILGVMKGGGSQPGGDPTQAALYREYAMQQAQITNVLAGWDALGNGPADYSAAEQYGQMLNILSGWDALGNGPVS